MPAYPAPQRPEIALFLRQLSGLTDAQWVEIVLRYVSAQSRAADATSIAARIVAGSDLNISQEMRDERIRCAHEAYDRIANAIGDIPESIRVDGEEVPLRGLANTAALHVVQALLVKEDIVNWPQVWQALVHPFDGFLDPAI